MYMEEFTNKTNLYKAKGFRTTHYYCKGYDSSPC